jgi:hypothetical protein
MISMAWRGLSRRNLPKARVPPRENPFHRRSTQKQDEADRPRREGQGQMGGKVDGRKDLGQAGGKGEPIDEGEFGQGDDLGDLQGAEAPGQVVAIAYRGSGHQGEADAVGQAVPH